MKYLIIIFLLALCGCQKERQVANEVMNRIVVKTIYKRNVKATLFKVSTITDITSYVPVEKDNIETIVFHGNFGSVIDLYFKGNDTLYLKCYKPSSNIIYVYESEMDRLKILKDTLITEEEYNIKTINK